jgi:hypothetical protein
MEFMILETRLKLHFQKPILVIMQIFTILIPIMHLKWKEKKCALSLWINDINFIHGIVNSISNSTYHCQTVVLYHHDITNHCMTSLSCNVNKYVPYTMFRTFIFYTIYIWRKKLTLSFYICIVNLYSIP